MTIITTINELIKDARKDERFKTAKAIRKEFNDLVKGKPTSQFPWVEVEEMWKKWCDGRCRKDMTA